MFIVIKTHLLTTLSQISWHLLTPIKREAPCQSKTLKRYMKAQRVLCNFQHFGSYPREIYKDTLCDFLLSGPRTEFRKALNCQMKSPVVSSAPDTEQLKGP